MSKNEKDKKKLEDYNEETEYYDEEYDFEQENSDEDKQDKLDALFKFNNNKHKREGKHALKRDIVFKGKLDKEEENGEADVNEYTNNNYDIEKGSIFEFESRKHEDYVIQKELSEDVFEILDKYTDLDFSSNRRRPNKQAFNGYYELLVKKLRYKYTNSEIFVELAFFFTDNIFNVFKLLDKEHATIIIKELKEKGYLKNLDNINFI